MDSFVECVRFYLFGGSGDRVRVRPETEPPGTPDRLVTWGSLAAAAIEGDSNYFPVRVLREQRR